MGAIAQTIGPSSRERPTVDLDSWYRRYGPMVLRRCRKLLRQEERAVDAMHDVFVEVLRRQGQVEETNPTSYLLTVATNTCLNRLRSQASRPEDIDETIYAIAAAPDSTEERSLARTILERIFGSEPASTRTIAVMHVVDGMTLEEVAREVGLSVSGVRKRLRTLRARVAELEGFR